MRLLLAKELDVHVEFTGMEFSAILSYVESGKALVGAGSIIVTDERKQVVDICGVLSGRICPEVCFYIVCICKTGPVWYDIK